MCHSEWIMPTTIQIALDADDAKVLSPLHSEFQRHWSQANVPPRVLYDRFVGETPVASGVKFREVVDAAGPGWWSEPNGATPNQAILFLHGGAYVMGTAKAYHGLASQFATRVRRPVFALDYPLAPEAQLPTALDMASSTLERLCSQYESVAVVGDSAGGGLSLATLSATVNRGLPIVGAALFSPWTDVTLSGDREGIVDPLLDANILRTSGSFYLGSARSDDPRGSPLFHVPKGLPPLLIQVGTDEILFDDSRRYAAAASAVGTEVQLEEWQGMHHVFQFNVAQLKSARLSLDRAAEFLARQFARGV